MPTLEQICANIMEDACEYQDKRIKELTDQLGTAYSRTFMHAAMIAHWATLFHKLVSTMIINFSATPSITIPAVRNLDPPPIFPTASRSRVAVDEPELEYPAEDDDWEVQSVDNTPALPIPPPEHHIHPEVLDHLHTLHVTIPAPPMHELGPNCKPITPTDPVPSMPSSPPQFLQVNPLDTAPSFADIVDALVQHDVNAQVAHVAREEEEERQTPLPTGPQPGIHPGPRWHANFKEAMIHYIFQIPTDVLQRYKITPFMIIDWNMTSLELLGMRGQGCPVYAKHLHVRADKFPCPAFDRCQEFFFVDRQTHLDGVDWAMQQEGDDTLHVEVICNCAAHAQTVQAMCRVADARDQLVDEQFILLQSTCCLACANAYCHLRCHITNTLTPATSMFSSCHITHIQEAVDSPWNWTDDKLSNKCLWCKRVGHKVEHYALIHICNLCCTYSHLEENCFQPHTCYISFQVCHVPLVYKHTHRHTCPSTIVIEQS